MAAAQTPSQTELSFDQILNKLEDETKSFQGHFLYRLSDLEPEELGQLRRLWLQLSAQRRLNLLGDLESLAEADTVMDFDVIHRLALGDVEPEIRTIALRSLWQSDQVDLVPIFIQILTNDRNSEVRAQAAAALGRFVYLGELGKVSAETLEKIETILLEQIRSDTDPLIQRRALESLGYSSRPEVAELIEEAYESGEEDWAASALVAMGRSADDRWAR